VVDDVFPGNLALNYIGADDVHNVVADVKQLDEVGKLLLNEFLLLWRYLVGNVLGEIQSYELSSR
jgi:hypothetical protein